MSSVRLFRLDISHSSLFGKGINPSIISSGKYGYVRISTPVDDDDIGQGPSDPLSPYTLIHPGKKAKFIFPSCLVASYFMCAFILHVIFVPSGLSLSSYLFYLTYLMEFFIFHVIAIPVGATLWYFSLDGFGIFRFRQLVARWSGDELFYHSIRLSVDYQSKLRETEGMLDFFQASPTTIAILQDNKIQLYDLETHQFLKQKTIQGMFNKSLLLKQSASFSTLDVVGNEVEECDFLVIYTKNDTELQFKICSLSW